MGERSMNQHCQGSDSLHLAEVPVLNGIAVSRHRAEANVFWVNVRVLFKVFDDNHLNGS